MQGDGGITSLLVMLAADPKPDAVARAVASLTGADLVLLHRASDNALALVASYGASPALRKNFSAMQPGLSTPQQDALRTREAQVLEASELVARYPLLTSAGLPTTGDYRIRAVEYRATPSGTLMLHMSHGAAGDAERRVDGIVAALALWLALDVADIADGVPTLRVTDRQRSVVAGLRRGLTNAAIAAELGFAVGTIKADITALSAQLGASGRRDLEAKARRAGI